MEVIRAAVMKTDQMSLLRGRIYNRRKGNRQDNLRQFSPKDQNDTSENRSTAETVADQYGVSAPTIKRDGKFAESVESLKEHVPDLEQGSLQGISVGWFWGAGCRVNHPTQQIYPTRMPAAQWMRSASRVNGKSPDTRLESIAAQGRMPGGLPSPTGTVRGHPTAPWAQPSTPWWGLTGWLESVARKSRVVPSFSWPPTPWRTCSAKFAQWWSQRPPQITALRCMW